MNNVAVVAGMVVSPKTNATVSSNKLTDSAIDTLPQDSFIFPGLQEEASEHYSELMEQAPESDESLLIPDGVLFAEVLDDSANEPMLLPLTHNMLSLLAVGSMTEQRVAVSVEQPGLLSETAEPVIVSAEEALLVAETGVVNSGGINSATGETVSAQQPAVLVDIPVARPLPFSAAASAYLPSTLQAESVVISPAVVELAQPTVVLPVVTVPVTGMSDPLIAPIAQLTEQQAGLLPPGTASKPTVESSALLFTSPQQLFVMNNGFQKAEHVAISSAITPVTQWQPHSPESVFQWRSENLGQQSTAWGQKLLHLLSDKVDLQLGQHIQRAQIRLDPPHLGAIELSIQVEGERTSVQLYASNNQVRDAMMQTLEQLRQTLSQRLGADMAVEVSVRQHSEQHSNKEQQRSSSQIAAQPENYDEIGSEDDTYQQQNTEWLNRLA